MKSLISKSLFGLFTLSLMSSQSFAKCVTVKGDCTGGCMVEQISVSGGSGQIENSNRNSAMVCSGYNGISGSYNYNIRTQSSVCGGSFSLSESADYVTINVYDNCKLNYISGN